MKTIGIVAEYNPFHNGHKYQIEQVKKQLNADNVVVVMSGNFVQRGGFAWTDKYLRARMAIDCGADFVFELPAVFACASAETFALGSVALLNSLGFVDEICFGSEEGSLELINKIASALTVKDYIPYIDKYLKSGLSFPAAREKYITKLFPEQKENISKILKQPNNILAIEYIKSLNKLESNIKPVTIKRMDAGYHSTTLCQDTTSDSEINHKLTKNFKVTQDNVLLSSASAIRNAFCDFNYKSNDSIKKTLTSVSEHLPKAVSDILAANLNRFPADNILFSDMLYYKLLSLKKQDYPLDIFSDVSSDLSERIYNKLPEYTDFDSFAATLKTKQYTHTRITRALTHILLDIKENDMQKFTSMLCNKNPILYARLLGMNKNKSKLLRNITSIPVITKVADAKNVFENFYINLENPDNINNADYINYTDKKTPILSQNIVSDNFINNINKMFEYDIFAADIYRHCLGNNVPDEYRAGVYIC